MGTEERPARYHFANRLAADGSNFIDEIIQEAAFLTYFFEVVP